MRRTVRRFGRLAAGATAVAVGGALATVAPAQAESADVPAFITVNQQADEENPGYNGGCKIPNRLSLNDALDDAVEGDTIRMCEGTHEIGAEPVVVDTDNIRFQPAVPVDEPPMIDAGSYEKDDSPFRIEADDVLIEDLAFSGSPGDGIHAADVDNLVIDGNEFSGDALNPIVVTGSANRNVVLQNNTIRATDGIQHAMVLRNIDGADVASNDITGHAAAPGIALLGGNDTVAVQGNRISDSKYAVYLGKRLADDAANTDVNVRVNSFDENVAYGVGVNPNEAAAAGHVAATDNYWGCADGAGAPGCAGVDADDGVVDTGAPLRSALSESSSATTSEWAKGVGVETSQVYVSGMGESTATVSEFEGNPRESIDDTVGKFIDVTTTERGDLDSLSLFDYAGKSKSLRWYDTSGDGSWRTTANANELPAEPEGPGGDPGMKATFDAQSTPALDDLRGVVFAAKTSN